MHWMLHETIQTRIWCTGTKLCTKIDNIKNSVKKSHQHSIFYYATCPKPGCVEDYTGKTCGRLNERVIDINGRDKKSHLYKQ